MGVDFNLFFLLGIRQKDPLSLYLFILSLEYLGILIYEKAFKWILERCENLGTRSLQMILCQRVKTSLVTYSLETPPLQYKKLFVQLWKVW